MHSGVITRRSLPLWILLLGVSPAAWAQQGGPDLPTPPAAATDEPGVKQAPPAKTPAQLFPKDDDRSRQAGGAPGTPTTGWPDRIGPFSISDKGGRFSLAVGLAAQLRFQLKAAANDGEFDDPRTKVELRRVRPTLRGTALSRDLGFYLHLSTAPGSVELLDLYLDYRFTDLLRLRVGQGKVPFTRYRIQSFKHLTFVDWSGVTRTFGAERQVGVTLHSGFEKPGKLAYAVGLYTGVNARSSHGLGLAPAYGEPSPNPSNLLDPAPPVTFHPELVVHGAYNAGGIDISTDTDWEGGPFRYSVGLSLAWDARPQEFVDLALRLAPELLLKGYGFSFMAMFYCGLAPSVGEDSSPRLAMLGALVQASYLIARRVELSARYGMVTVDTNIMNEARARAAGIIAAAKTPEEEQALRARYGAAGTLDTEHEVTLGTNVYIIGRSLKWRTDLGYKERMLEVGSKSEVLLRTQVQLAF